MSKKAKHLYSFGFLITCLVVLISGIAGTAQGASSEQAKIIDIRGKGEFRIDEKASWVDAKIKQPLTSGNYVQTGSYSRMALLFRDNTQLRLNQKTILKIRDIEEPTKGVGDTILRLNIGRVWTQTNTPSRPIIMETPSATAAIRGTDWELEVDNKGAATITVFSGKVQFYNDFGQVVVDKNEQAKAEMGKAPVKLLIVNPEDRVQWVTAYTVEPLRHISLHGLRVRDIKKKLDKMTGKSADDLAGKGNLLADAGYWSEAENNFQAALELNSKHGRALLGLGYVALQNNTVDKAESYFKRASQFVRTANEKELLALGNVVLLVNKEQLNEAVAVLKQLIVTTKLEQPAAYLILSDIMIFSGDLQQAQKYAEEGVHTFPYDPKNYSQLARIYLLKGQANESEKQIQLALQQDNLSYEALLGKGSLSRFEGKAYAAKKAYKDAQSVKPKDDRAWYGLGVINTEKEEVTKARSNLFEALAINPKGPGYYGELGTLETFADNFKDAETAFDKGLESAPGDYTALTGKGLLELKRGNHQKALELFLQAGLLEPRYARVHVYTAVAYYQGGWIKQALKELELAAELDEKDPMPHFMASIIYTDLLMPGEAIKEARKSMELMPYLKSLNQIATDKSGSANLGNAFAFFGMEEWAQSYAQRSYYPFWAGSHLFLADRYNGMFNKNSELFQGFLVDPTVFGASNRFQKILPAPTFNFNASFRLTEGDGFKGNSPLVETSGFGNSIVPTAYYLGYENFDIDFDDGPYVRDTYTAALGIKPNYHLGAFVFVDHSDLDSAIIGNFSGTDFDLDDELKTDRVDIGFHYKFSPTSQAWIKGGFFFSDEDLDGSIDFVPVLSNVEVDQPEYGFRHTFKAGRKNELTWGIETSDRDTESIFKTEDTFLGLPLITTLDYRYSEDSRDFYVSDRMEVTSKFLIQADLMYQRHEREAIYYETIELLGTPVTTVTNEQFYHSQVNPRLGFIYNFSSPVLLRAAYQKWLRPSSFGSLGPVATAGIPIDDRMVLRGGELERSRGQIEWEVNQKMFAFAYFDYEEIENNLFSLTPYTVSDLENLKKLRTRDLGALARQDLLEFINTPEYESGRIKRSGLSLNYIISKHLATTGTYIYTSSTNTGTTHNGNQLPYLPEHTAALGITWSHHSGWYFISRFPYRSERFKDEASTERLEPGWDGAFDIYWQSPQKHWLARFSIDEIYDQEMDEQYTAEITMRF